MEKATTDIVILGSTGSIGTQTLDVVRRYPDRFRVKGLAVRSKADAVILQAREFNPEQVVVADKEAYEAVSKALPDTEVLFGEESMCGLAGRDDVDMVVTATVGYSGLAPTIAAIEKGKDIALANKETLVVAGELVSRLLEKSGTRIYPVDSEHSAIYQSLAGEDIRAVNKLIITASGGPFRNMSATEMESVTVAQALNHPRWSMGPKITVDSATMLNKAFEIIEAHWLFGMPAEKIEAVIHPQSIVHSMVQFNDGAVKAQLGVPDMKVPIAYALSRGERLASISRFMDISDYSTMEFYKPDMERFPALGLAYETLGIGGTAACTVNAANEVAVAAFLQSEIKFKDIYRVIRATLDGVECVPTPEYEDYVEVNRKSREFARDYIKRI